MSGSEQGQELTDQLRVAMVPLDRALAPVAQADRRVLLLPQAARELTAVQRASAAPSAPQDPEVVRTKLLEVVTQWWDD